MVKIVRKILSPRIFYNELRKQIKELNINSIFSEEEMLTHFKHGKIRNTVEHPDLYITQIRYYRLYDYLKDLKGTILDIGDPSGILLKALGKKGTGLNNDAKCIEDIKKRGIEAVLGDAERLPFGDNSFDYVFNFQCLEHIPGFIKALQEMARVGRKKIFISIMHTSKTIVYSVDFWRRVYEETWKKGNFNQYDGHIMEFSAEDFKKILTYAGLKCEHNFLLNCFDNNTLLRRLLNKSKPFFNFFLCSK